MKRNIPFISASVIRRRAELPHIFVDPVVVAAFSGGLTKKEDRLEPFSLFTHVSSFHVAGHDVRIDKRQASVIPAAGQLNASPSTAAVGTLQPNLFSPYLP